MILGPEGHITIIDDPLDDKYYPANPHVEQPCSDNPQPCGCNPCCCNDCQGTCHHMVEEYEKERRKKGNDYEF